MSATTPRQRLGRLFHRRDVSGGASEPAEHGPPPTADTRENRHVRRKSSLRSLREFVHNTSRSLSRTRQPLKRDPSCDVPQSRADQTSPTRFAYAEDSLPQIEHQSSLSSDLAHLVFTDSNEPRPRINSVSNQPALRRRARKLSHEDRRPRPNTFAGHGIHIETRMEPNDPYSEHVADLNMAHSHTPLVSALHDLPAPLRITKSRSSDLSSGSPGSRYMPSQLSHKPDIQDLRRSIENAENLEPGRPQRSGTKIRSIRRSSLQKPLPELPLPLGALSGEESYDSAVNSELGQEPGYLVKDSKTPVDLKGVVDLRDTVDTDVQKTWSPAVIHEKRIVNTHEIVQRAITREIHNHHIFHRVLPIMDIEVLPARHFVLDENGGLVEIPAEEAPVESPERLHQLISETVANMMPKTEAPAGPRQFTACNFEGTDGDYKEYITPEGFMRTEQWWVHPPTLETGAQEDGQTIPFHLGSENPGDDGLRGAGSNVLSSQPHASLSSWHGVANQDPVFTPTHHTIVPIKMTHGGRVPQQAY